MALIKARRAQKFAGGGLLNIGVLANVACLAGGLAMQVGGFVRPARAGQGGNALAQANDAAAGVVVGLFSVSAVGGAVDGAVRVEIEQGTFLFKNSAGVDAITAARVNRPCFVVDDETVALTSLGGLRPRAGIVREVGAEGVWVEISAPAIAMPGRVFLLPFFINEVDTLAGTSAELVSPVAGSIAKLSVIVQKAVTTGGPVTAAVGVTAVAGLSCVIADAAAKGTIVEDTPTFGDATTAVAVGSRIQIIPDAAFATAGAISGFIEIAY
jgi:hypothetical protein